MASTYTAKPASASHAEPVSKFEQIGGPLNRPDTPSTSKAQAPWRPPADVRQSDLEYFRRNPGARHRFRAARPGEFRTFVLAVVATVTRNAAGQPITISRDLYRLEGGHA